MKYALFGLLAEEALRRWNPMKYRSCWCSFDFLLTKLHMIIISVQEIASVLTIDQTSKIAFAFQSEQ